MYVEKTGEEPVYFALCTKDEMGLTWWIGLSQVVSFDFADLDSVSRFLFRLGGNHYKGRP